MAAAEEMHMKVKNGLARAAAVVEHGAIAGEEIALPGQFGGDKMQLAKDRLVRRRSIVERGEMLAGADEKVSGSLWGDILERENVVIFIDNLRGDFPGPDFAE